MNPKELNELTNYAPDLERRWGDYFVGSRTNELARVVSPQVRGVSSLIRLVRRETARTPTGTNSATTAGKP
jgi:hypothetical protein